MQLINLQSLDEKMPTIARNYVLMQRGPNGVNIKGKGTKVAKKPFISRKIAFLSQFYVKITVQRK